MRRSDEAGWGRKEGEGTRRGRYSLLAAASSLVACTASGLLLAAANPSGSGHLAGILGLGEEVGHDGEEEGERLGEHDADLGVEDGAGVGEATEEVEVEEECGKNEHENRGGHHGALIFLVGVGGSQVIRIRVDCVVAE